MPAPAKLTELVDRFERNFDAYKAGKYNETQVRREFIDPFLKLLGWDVDNEKGHAEAYKNVVHEDAIRVGRSTKAPDYSLRIGGQRKLFVEAKKPSVNIKEDVSPAFQVRRYAWSANLPLSILTDFEEFAVYDCRQKPNKADKASHSRILYFTFREYVQKWDELLALFSPEAIMQGSFDKFVQDNRKKRGTTVVNDAFLAEISAWRTQLAQNIALRNKGIKTRQLNFAVQRTIDRLIFLRIAEDRGIEHYGRLREHTEGSDSYQKLGDLFKQADQKYNSGIFHFKREKGRDEESLDTFTLNLTIDDKILKQIIKSLYYPDSPYQFDMIPADILGQVYEQFLGKVIRLTAGGRAKIEEKPEVKKAGGVFYTPTYIVDYIVGQTVGKLLAGKKPDGKNGARKLRILDPACGSGSFLLGAYQFLLDYYLDAYLQDAEKWARRKEPPLYQNENGEWKLTIIERKRILLNNIYGVDIDPQAVEVTKLSLLLKVMEGETEATLGTQLRLLPERVLPDLSANIKCGNSLIGPDFYDGQMSLGILDEEEMYRINVFDWATAFPEIVPWGGFDAVIGNPPYIRIQAMKQWAPKEVEFYKKAYKAASKGNYDIYVVFVEKGLELLNQNGVFGFILPHKFFNAKYGAPLREYISNGKFLSSIVDFGYQQVFQNATTYTCLFFLTKKSNRSFHYSQVDDLIAWQFNHEAISGEVETISVDSTEWNFIVGKGKNLFHALESIPTRLGHVADIFVGLQTSADPVYLLEKIEVGDSNTLVYSRSLKCNIHIENAILKPLLKGSEIHRFYVDNPRNLILFPYKISENKAFPLSESELAIKFPLTWAYFKDVKNKLQARDGGAWHNELIWWQFGRNQSISEMNKSKILTQVLAKNASYSYDLDATFCFVGGGNAGGYGLSSKDENYPDLFLLGLLNTKLLDFYLRNISTPFRGGYYSYGRRFIEQLPICDIDELKQKQIINQVRQMLALHKRLAGAQTAHEKTVLQRQIQATDSQIDQLVYQLYALTPAEIAIVEGA